MQVRKKRLTTFHIITTANTHIALLANGSALGGDTLVSWQHLKHHQKHHLPLYRMRLTSLIVHRAHHGILEVLPIVQSSPRAWLGIASISSSYMALGQRTGKFSNIAIPCGWHTLAPMYRTSRISSISNHRSS